MLCTVHWVGCYSYATATSLAHFCLIYMCMLCSCVCWPLFALHCKNPVVLGVVVMFNNIIALANAVAFSVVAFAK